jgi:hypothetical protein
MAGFDDEAEPHAKADEGIFAGYNPMSAQYAEEQMRDMRRDIPWRESPPALQPLRIPGGWVVELNDFREADASAQSVAAGWLREDLLQLKHARAEILIDVGWYGDFGSGQFAIYVMEGDFDGTRVHEFRSRERRAVVAELERLLQSPFLYR